MVSPILFMILTPLTPLDAVNEILAAIGEAPVDALDTGNVDVENAYRILVNTNRQIQIKGWSFNTIKEYPLMPDKFTKEIAWDSQLLKVETDDGSILRNRSGIVYDTTNNNDHFEDTRTVEAIVLVPFEEVPEVFKTYITVRAARVFSSRYLGDESILQTLTQEEQMAYQAVMEYEVDIENPSMANNMEITQAMKR